MPIKAGTTVVWTNKDDTPHTVTNDDNVLASSVMDINAKFQYTMLRAGLVEVASEAGVARQRAV
jgi:plastocyanin